MFRAEYTAMSKEALVEEVACLRDQVLLGGKTAAASRHASFTLVLSSADPLLVVNMLHSWNKSASGPTATQRSSA
jgi:hypothetical protein